MATTAEIMAGIERIEPTYTGSTLDNFATCLFDGYYDTTKPEDWLDGSQVEVPGVGVAARIEKQEVPIYLEDEAYGAPINVIFHLDDKVYRIQGIYDIDGYEWGDIEEVTSSVVTTVSYTNSEGK
jgi:hypothetical protein